MFCCTVELCRCQTFLMHRHMGLKMCVSMQTHISNPSSPPSLTVAYTQGMGTDHTGGGASWCSPCEDSSTGYDDSRHSTQQPCMWTHRKGSD